MAAVSVVLPTRDRPELLRDAIASVQAALRDGDELLVADSASTDPRVRAVVEQAGAQYIRCDLPGASRARNAGWRAARNEIVAYFDDDVRVSPDWLNRIDETFERHPGIGFVTGRVLEPPDTDPSERAVAIKDDDEPMAIGRFTGGALGQTANTAVRRVALEKIGGFDELLGPGGDLNAIAEDVDMYDRLLGAGFEGRYEPAVLAYHVQWRDREDFLKLDWRYGVGSGYRVAKVLRLDRERVALVARAVFWEWGATQLWWAARRRLKFLTLLNVVRLLGMCVGLVRGLLTPIEQGHLVRRSRRLRLARA